MGSARGGMLALRGGKTLRENLEELIERFPVDKHGYFGVKGKGGKNNVRNIFTDNPGRVASEFASIAVANPSVTHVISGKGFTWVLRDGGRVTYRWISTSDKTPVVEIMCNGVSAIPNQKIHFVPKKKEE